MTIQINTDKNLTVNQEYNEKIQATISSAISRFSEHITRIEVHFSDENGGKSGTNDKRCLLEARLEHSQPIVVTEFSHTYDFALNGALEKLKNMLNTLVDKRKGK